MNTGFNGEVENGKYSVPVGQLGIIPLPGCEEMAKGIDYYIVNWRRERAVKGEIPPDATDYIKDSYIVNMDFHRFGTGEGKAALNHTVRGYDLFILCDCFNYGVTYKMYGQYYPMSPDEHYANLKRAISAVAGKARRINVVMPMLYEGRQHKRSTRESLDCANALQELCFDMGVDNILTFDAHDPRVQNAIPLKGFESIQPSYQMIKAMTREIPDIKFDKDHLMIISPDEGGMSRCIYYSSILGVELGMFYKLRDYTRVVDGRNPIIAHEFLGHSVEGKDVIIVDDMISSGESMIDVAIQLKKRGAKRILVNATFGLFCNGLAQFDQAFADGLIYRVFTTNLVYRTEELKKRQWFCEVNCFKYLSYITDILNHDMSVSKLLEPKDKIVKLLNDYNNK